MTVGDLIDILKTFDPALPVVTPGFDEAYLDDVAEVKTVGVIFNATSGNHCGRHIDATNEAVVAMYAKQRKLEPTRLAVLVNF